MPTTPIETDPPKLANKKNRALRAPGLLSRVSVALDRHVVVDWGNRHLRAHHVFVIDVVLQLATDFWFLGNHDRHDDVEQQPGATHQRQSDKRQAHQGRVDIKILRKPATYSGEMPASRRLGCCAVQAFLAHVPSPVSVKLGTQSTP